LKYSKYVLAVDDGSKDNTSKEIKKTKAIYLINKSNKGKGYSLKRGFDYAIKNNFDIVITIDADGQHDPKLIPEFIKEIEKGFDVVIGTRRKRYSNMPYLRRISNFILSLIFSAFSRTWIKDTQSGYRAIKVNALKNLKLKTNRYETESEILMKLGRKGAKFGKVNIPVIYNDEVSSINPVKDALRFIKVLKHRK
jgi:glycosyltransferase involved in cell wall biosynthesis